MRTRQTLAPQHINQQVQRTISQERNTISTNQQFLQNTLSSSSSTNNLNQRSISLTRPQFNSLAPNQQSLGGGGNQIGNKKSNQDTKQIQQNQIDSIFTFLTSHNYDQMVSMKMLQQPSQKVFFQVFQFLLNIYDPFLGQIQPEDIPLLMKYMGYPHTLSKNMFIAIGAPHTWSHVLNLLNWLCNILRYKQAAQSEEEERQRVSPSHYNETDAEIINEYITESFLMGNEGNKQGAMNAVKDKLRKRRERLDQEIRDYEMKIETMLLAKKNLMNDQPDLHELDLKISQQAEKIFRENELIIRAESELQQAERDLETERKTLGKRREELQQLHMQKQGYEEVIDQQEFDINEAKRFENEIQQNLQLKNKLLEHKEAKKTQIAKLYQEMDLLFQETDKMISEYNQIIQNQQQIVNCSGIVAKINFDIFKEPLKDYIRKAINEGNFKILKNEFIGFDMKHTAHAKLQQMLQQTKLEINEVKQVIVETEKEIKRLDGELMELQNEKKLMKSSQESQMERLNKNTENFKLYQRQFQGDCDKLQKELTTLNIDFEKSKAEEHQATNQLQIEMNELEKVQIEQQSIFKELEEIKLKDNEKIKQFKSEIIQILKLMDDKVKSVNQKFKEQYPLQQQQQQ